jgi:hypoxanthine phosphoribosyltransferase
MTPANAGNGAGNDAAIVPDRPVGSWPDRASVRCADVDDAHVGSDLTRVLYTPDQLNVRLREIAAEIDEEYRDKDLLLIGVLSGAVMVMADLSRALSIHCEMDWMAISSYGSGTQSSGVVRILKDLNTDIADRHVLVVEDIIDTGLTLSYLISNLRSRNPAGLDIMTMFRKPEAARSSVSVRWVGFDIPNEFVVGYGLDYDGRYRNLTSVGTLAPHVYS